MGRRPSFYASRLKSVYFQVVAFAVLSVATSVLLVWLGTFLWVRAQLRQWILESNAALAARVAWQADRAIQEALDTLTYLAQDPRLQSGDRSTLGAALAELRQHSRRFGGLSFIDSSGRLLAVDPPAPSVVGLDLSGRDYVRAVLGVASRYVSDGFEAATGNRIVALSVPVRADGRLVGVLTGAIHLDRFNLLTALLQDVPVGAAGYVYVVDRQGRLLFHPDRSRIMEDVRRNPVVARVMAGQSGVAEVTNSPGLRMLAAHHPMTLTGWGVVAQVPVEQAMVPLRRLTASIAALAALLGVLVGTVSFVLVRRILGPLRLLEAAMRAVAAGEVPEQLAMIARLAPDEFQRLHAAFSALLSRISTERETLRRRAQTDPLTGLYNHGAFWLLLGRALEAAREQGRPVSLLMIDVDNFKAFNDALGHLAGDEALQRLAGVLMRSVRSKDLVARYGGEEFAVILPETDTRVALQVAQRIRAEVAALRPRGHALTVSIGVASFPADASAPRELVDTADRAMYRAKRDGKNRCAAAGPAA